MPRDFYPRPEAAIVSFTANVTARISAAPADYGVSPEAASEYASLQRAFAEAYQTVQSPGTNASAAYVAKDAARIALERATRLLVKTVAATATVTGAMRIELGLNPRAPRRQRRPVPDAPPILRIAGTVGSAVHWQLIDATGTKRRRPRDVSGAVFHGCVGAHPPAHDADWRMMGLTSRATGEVTFDPSLPPGTMVWLQAFWFNARGEPGPACAPVCTYLACGAVPQPAVLRRAA